MEITIKRSEAAENAFKHDHPCPSTGRNSGSCPGYVIDHVHPLECGGADAPFNMQWQTVADGKAKNETERYKGHCPGRLQLPVRRLALDSNASWKDSRKLPQMINNF